MPVRASIDMRASFVWPLLLAACGADSASDLPLTVRSVTPAANAVDVALDTPIVLELSAPPPEGFTVALTEGGEPVPHQMTVEGATVTLVPDAPLWLAAGYTLAVPDAEHSSTFATRDGTWKNLALGTQTMLAAAPLGAGAAPSIASLPDGTVLAGWEGGSAIYDQKFTPAAGWLATPNMLVISGGDPDGVRIAAASPTRAIEGHAKYVTRANMEARTYDGARWSPVVVVAPYLIGMTRYDQYLGNVAATDQTYALAFHRGSFDNDLFDLYLSIHSGSTWSAPVLAEQLPGSAGGSDLIADGRGGYVLAWIQRSADKTKTAVYVATVSGTGTVGAPQLVDDGPGTTFSLTLARGGDTTWLAWAHQQGTIGMRFVARPFTNGALGAAHTIELAGASPYGEWARIAASPRGAALVYTQYGSVSAAVFANGTWSQPTELDKIPTGPNDDVGRPVVTVDDRGNATAVWTRVPGSGRRTTVVSRARDGQWSPVSQLDEGTGSTYAWTAGVDATGRVTTGWTQSTPTGYAVWGAHLQ
jgi:Bacterial Ig-like domain